MLRREVVCAACRHEFVIDAARFSESLKCPSCEQTLRMDRVESDPAKKQKKPEAISKKFRESASVYGATQFDISAFEIRERQQAESLRRSQLEGDAVGVPIHRRKETDAAQRMSPSVRRQHLLKQYQTSLAPRLPDRPFQYPSHWTFDLATAVNAVLAMGIFGLYLLLIVALSGSLVYHLFAGFAPLVEARGWMLAFRLAIYLGLFLLGLMIVGFLIKPFFVKVLRPSRRRVSREEEPLLYHFVDQIARYGGVHDAIDIELTQFSTLRLERKGARPCLWVGMPEMAIWDTRQFACSLAEVLGNRAQINEFTSLRMVDWLVTWWWKAAERVDPLDYRLRRAMKGASDASQRSIEKAYGPSLFLFWFASEACHKLFQFFYVVTRRFSAGMLRQVSEGTEEFASDLVGAEGVASTVRESIILERLYEPTVRHFLIALGSRSQVTDFASFLALNQAHMLGDIDAEVATDLARQTTSRLDFQACGKVRAERAAKRDEPGRYRVEVSARELLLDFQKWSQLTTRDLASELQVWDWHAIAFFPYRQPDTIQMDRGKRPGKRPRRR